MGVWGQKGRSPLSTSSYGGQAIASTPASVPADPVSGLASAAMVASTAWVCCASWETWNQYTLGPTCLLRNSLDKRCASMPAASGTGPAPHTTRCSALAWVAVNLHCGHPLCSVFHCCGVVPGHRLVGWGCSGECSSEAVDLPLPLPVATHLPCSILRRPRHPAPHQRRSLLSHASPPEYLWVT